MTSESWLYANPPQDDSGRTCSHQWIYHYKVKLQDGTRFAKRKMCMKCGIRMAKEIPEHSWSFRGYAGYAPCEREHVIPKPTTRLDVAPEWRKFYGEWKARVERNKILIF